MTSLALTVCAHIAATLYTPRFCAFEYRFLPFPNLTPNPPSALPYSSLVVEGLGRGDGDGSGGCAHCLAGGGGDGKGDGDGSGGYVLGLAVGGGDGRYHALVLSGAEVNPTESLLVL